MDATLTIYDPPADIKRHAWLLLTAKLQDVKCLPLLSKCYIRSFSSSCFSTTEAIFSLSRPLPLSSDEEAD